MSVSKTGQRSLHHAVYTLMEDIQFPPIHSAGPGSPFLLLTPPTTHFHSFYLTLRTSIAAIFFVACLRQVLEAV